ncbi:hypothetical protein COO60DRAFT_257765 [Scenedesmus sp. NREL 46B-D3]|nr:hypothetical protein COO60DRAFT_257765 [Scenedesmus sp. NREL 46B-D3]
MSSSLSSWTSPLSVSRRTNDRTPRKQDQTPEELQDEVKKLRNDLKDTQGRLARSHNDAAKLVAQVKAYSARHDEGLQRIQELQGATAEAATLRARLKEVEAARDAEHLAFLQQSVACQELQRKRDEQAKQLEELPRLRSGLVEVQSELKERTEQLAASQAAQAAAEAELTCIRQQLQDAQAATAAQQQQLEEARAAAEAAQQQQHQQVLDELKAEHAQLQTQHDEVQQAREQLQQQLEEVQASSQLPRQPSCLHSSCCSSSRRGLAHWQLSLLRHRRRSRLSSRPSPASKKSSS